MISKPTMTLRGIPGLGDEIQQRAIVRALLPKYNIRLATTWPCVYHDFIDQGVLSAYRRPVGLRMQAQNAVRDVEQARFSRAPSAPYQMSGAAAQLYYNGLVERTPSHTVLEAMFQSVGIGGDYKNADYRMPIRPEWFDSADRLIDSWKPQKPILIYRPPIFRAEAPASGVRNPNPTHYAEIAAMLRDSFFVVSIAALTPREWIVGPVLRPDADLTHGELIFDTMAALFARAALVLTPGGFPAILAPAVETPCINIMGGYQPAAWVADGGKFSPFLGIDTKSPCECYSRDCRRLCPKEIDLAAARPRVLEFAGLSVNTETRPASEMHDPATPPPHQQRQPMRHPNIGHYPAVRPVEGLRRPPVRA